MSESFEKVLGRLKSIVPHDDNSKGLTPMVSVPWVEDIACRLEDAHEAEMKQLSKAEFHRGYEAGKAARNADEWQLDRERAKAIEAIRKVVPEGYFGSHNMLSEICRAIYSPVFGWTAEAGRDLCDRLIYLLGGENHKLPAESDAESAKNGENHQFVGYDELSNERHKAACNIAEIRSDAGGFVKALAKALGIDWQAPRVSRNIALICKQLIYLLDGTQDAPNATDFAGNRQNGPKSGEKPPEMQKSGPESCESLQEVEPSPITDERHEVVCRLRKFEPYIFGKPTEEASKLIRCIIGREDCYVACVNDLEEARDRLIRLLVGDECNFSGVESDIDAQDDGTNPAETPEEQNDHVSLGTPLSLTEELREWATERTCKGISYTDVSNLALIADRIDAQFNRICSQQEAVLQQTISDTVDEHECEMAELRADYEQAISDITGVERGEGSDLLMPVDVFLHVRDGLRRDVEMWRDRSEDMRMERDGLQAELDKWKGLADTNAKALLRINAENANRMRAAERDADVMENLSGQLADMTRERDDLQDRLQAISALCEQDDG